jgi:hypothetical protein
MNFRAIVFLQGDEVRLLPGCLTGRPAKNEITVNDESRKKVLERLLKMLRKQKLTLTPKVKYESKDGKMIAKVTCG